MNRIDQLTGNLKIIQNDEVFSFSIDAVLLAHFANIPKKGTVVDLCSGNGAVGLMISEKTKAKIKMIELQKRLATMATESIELNHKDAQIEVFNIPLQESLSVITHDSCDAIVCNPPYFQTLPDSKKNPNPYLAIARHEIHTNLNDIMRCSKQLLKTRGKLFLVHRPERLIDIINACQSEGLAVKTCRFIYPKINKDANMVIIEAIKGGKQTGLKVLPPFYVHNENGEYSHEMMEIFNHG